MKNLVLVVVCLASMMLSGCSTRLGDFTVASTKNINLASDGLIQGERVTGHDGVPAVLFPIGIPNIQSAVDDAIDKERCVVGLENVTLEMFEFYLLVGYFSYDITGTQVIDTNIPGCEHYKG